MRQTRKYNFPPIQAYLNGTQCYVIDLNRSETEFQILTTELEASFHQHLKYFYYFK